MAHPRGAGKRGRGWWGWLADAEGRVISVVELDVADGVVQAIHAVVNPDKLGHIGPVSDVARLPEKPEKRLPEKELSRACPPQAWAGA